MAILIGLGVWFITLLTIPGAAQKRGRKPGPWFLLAIFIGVLAYLPLLIMGTSEDHQPHRSIIEERVPTLSPTQQLKELGDLKAAGLLTAEEFDTKKAVLLDRI
jgi:hypothetical protein